MTFRRPHVVSALAFCYACAASLPAAAHGFGQRYDLPIPLSLYLWGAGAVVTFSFVIFAFFLSSERAARPLPHGRYRLRGNWRIAARALVLIVRLLALIVFLTVVLGGLFGEQNPFRNIAPTMIWIIGWVGIAFLSPVLGNIWQFLNPWDASFRARAGHTGAFASVCQLMQASKNLLRTSLAPIRHGSACGRPLRSS